MGEQAVDLLVTLGEVLRQGGHALERGLAIHLPGLQRHLIDYLDQGQRADLEQILRTLRARLEAERGEAGRAVSP